MCGIAGLFDTRGRRVYAEELIRRMNDVQVHRGPDEGGVHIEPGVALGHRRLSIIDIATGQQPLANEDGSVIVVYNGEIYNFRELIPELEAAGHVFRTRSDTEVIVHAWEAWGEACVQRFRGMFAFALWDRNRRELFLARDRMGVKPLYYAWLNDGTFLFGSELKVLTLHPQFPRALDACAVEEYFALGYVPEPRTIYQGARKLAPGHHLTVRDGATAAMPVSYWDVRFGKRSVQSADDLVEELRQRIREAVEVRLVSEVPLGAFLSGGVDSSAVVATMAGLSNEPVRTCAIAFDDPAFDESRHAASVAGRYATDHHVETVSADGFDLIDSLAWHYDEPFADSSAIPTWRVCALARRHVTVALSGDGGDESFGGYRRYRLHLAEQRVRGLLPAGLRRALFGTLGQLYPKADWAPRPLRAKTTFQALARDEVAAYLHGVSMLREEERMPLYSARLRRELGGYSTSELFRGHAERAGTDDPLALVQYLDYKTYLTGDINVKVDRASMAHSLEVREPLMDHELIEWLSGLPSDLKIHNGESKWLLKKAFEPLLPRDVLYRPKMGFSVPLATWLRGPLAGRLSDVVQGARLADTGLFDMARLAAMADAHATRRRDYSEPLWSVLMFDAFLKREEQRPAARAA